MVIRTPSGYAEISASIEHLPIGLAGGLGLQEADQSSWLMPIRTAPSLAR
jgi:hypothetical protein